jgi:tetratricopeptide (TPR) repeat protein
MLKLGVLWLMCCILGAGQTPPTDSATLLKQAQADFAKGDLVNARAAAETLHVANPTDAKAAVLLANCYIKMGRSQAAVDVLKPLDRENSSNVEFQYSLAFAEIESGNQSEGLPLLEKVAVQTHSASAWAAAGSARLQRNEFAEAKRDVDAAWALNPSLTGLATMDGQVRHALGDTDGAVPFFEAALRANPRDFVANLYLGMARMKEGEYETARKLLELAVQLKPDAPVARLNLAELNALTGHTEEAVKELESLERQAPDWPEPHIRLAALYYKLHRPEDGQREREIVEQIQAKQQQAGPPKD